MRVCVVGCGAVGSLFAAHLARLDDVEVWAFDVSQRARRRDQRERSAPDGCGRRPRPTPRATTDASRAAALRLRHRRDEGDAHGGRDRRDGARVRGRCRRDGAERRRQRGGGRRHAARVIRGTTFPAGKILEPGVVQWDVKGDTTLGPFEPQPASADEIERLADACTRGGMPTSAVADARPAQWRKVIFNASTNPVGALTGLTHGRVCERPDLRAIVSALVDEGKAVAAAQGIELDADPEELIDHAAKPEVAYDHKASMLQDVEARRATEIDYPERRHRALRAASSACRRRSTTPSHDSSRDWRPHGWNAERRAAAAARERPRRDGRARPRRADRLGKRVHGLRGRGDVHVRLPDRPSLRVRRRPRGRRGDTSSSRRRRGTSASTGRPSSSRSSTTAPAS